MDVKLPLPSNDNHGKIYELPYYIQREIQAEYWPTILRLLEAYKKNDFVEKGIVAAKVGPEANTLIHPKYYATYPYEWPANMLKSALLHHLHLFLELDQFEMTLKDA